MSAPQEPKEIRVERISVPEKERTFPWSYIIAFVISITIVGSGCYYAFLQYRQNNAQIRQYTERSFKKLNISIDDFDENQILALRPLLEGYTADFCDARSKYTLIGRVHDVGFVQVAAKLSKDQYEKCAKNLDFLAFAATYYEELGDHSRALEIINRVVDLGPATADYRYGRGKINEAMGNFDKALLDHISALDLLGRPEAVGVQQFYEIAKMYAALKRFCEAATPLETYISYDFSKRSSEPQIGRLISEYRSKGNCKQSTSKDNASVPFRKSGGVILVEAKLNNVTGIFIFDTGASTVAVTKSFANKARIPVNLEDRVTLQTANGIAEGLLATANSIQVGNAYSTSVPVVVQEDATLGNDDNVVGLLGMSFLSRFAVTVEKDSVELRSRF